MPHRGSLSSDFYSPPQKKEQKIVMLKFLSNISEIRGGNRIHLGIAVSVMRCQKPIFPELECFFCGKSSFLILGPPESTLCPKLGKKVKFHDQHDSQNTLFKNKHLTSKRCKITGGGRFSWAKTFIFAQVPPVGVDISGCH